ncbi:MAG: hypothetical protein QNJ98_08670 [Planctomycetota bacterium]|nr:hypothetical protein [Planctomycetota bacterium]
MRRRTKPRWKKEPPAAAYRWFLETFERAMKTPAPARQRASRVGRPTPSHERCN